MDIISTYFKELWNLLTEMSPYLLFGFFFSGLIHIFLQNEVIGRHLKGNNFRSVLNASLLGVPLPLCSCGVIPAGLSFYKNGASKGSTVSFLISTPQTGIDSILVTYSLLGLPFAIIRPFVALFTGVAGGVATNIFNKGLSANQSQFKKMRERTTFFHDLKEVFNYGFIDLIQDIAKWLVIGLLLAALIAVIIPDDFFIQYVNKPWLNMFLVLAASVPLYICATGSVPIAAVLMMKGLSPGAALVFLMAGPATNIATIIVLSKTFGRKTTLIYISTIIIGALFFGYLIDTFMPMQWFAIMNHDHGGHHLLPEWISIFSALLIIALIINGYILKKINEKKVKMKKIEFTQLKAVQKFKVEGMTCKNCKAHVEKNVSLIEGIEQVTADFISGEVSVTGKNIIEEEIKNAVEKAGYIFKGKL